MSSASMPGVPGRQAAIRSAALRGTITVTRTATLRAAGDGEPAADPGQLRPGRCERDVEGMRRSPAPIGDFDLQP